jgi:hypothetical protein
MNGLQIMFIYVNISLILVINNYIVCLLKNTNAAYIHFTVKNINSLINHMVILYDLCYHNLKYTQGRKIK